MSLSSGPGCFWKSVVNTRWDFRLGSAETHQTHIIRQQGNSACGHGSLISSQIITHLLKDMMVIFSVSFLNTNFNVRTVTLQASGPQRHDWTRHYSVQHGDHPFLTTSECGLKDPKTIPSVFIPLMCSNPLWSSHQKHVNVRWSTHWRIDSKIDWL